MRLGLELVSDHQVLLRGKQDPSTEPYVEPRSSLATTALPGIAGGLAARVVTRVGPARVLTVPPRRRVDEDRGECRKLCRRPRGRTLGRGRAACRTHTNVCSSPCSCDVECGRASGRASPTQPVGTRGGFSTDQAQTFDRSTLSAASCRASSELNHGRRLRGKRGAAQRVLPIVGSAEVRSGRTSPRWS